MSKQYRLAIVIGRFQPLHNGHLELFKKAAEVADQTIVLVGSSYKARDTKNPFSFDERSTMLEGALGHGTDIYPLVDHLYSDPDWVTQVQRHVNRIQLNRSARELITDDDICIVGHKKDASSYYLNFFPQWDFIETNSYIELNATDIRNRIFGGEGGPNPFEDVPVATEKFIREFAFTQHHRDLVEEHKFWKRYREPYDKLPYPPIFVTVDSVVLCGGHVLLVKRGQYPGKGLWALPGGFLDGGERIQDGIIRELLEETRIKVPREVLINSLKFVKVFDAPGRSLRGRTITHAGLFVLNQSELPKVRGSDDVERAKWFPLHKALNMPELYFEDHGHIVPSMVGAA